jgi:hypothetical protein
MLLDADQSTKKSKNPDDDGKVAPSRLPHHDAA